MRLKFGVQVEKGRGVGLYPLSIVLCASWFLEISRLLKKKEAGHLRRGERKETMLVKLLGSGSAVGVEVEALSGNLPAETTIVIGKSVVIGKGRVEAGREMIMIETNLGRGDGPDEYICTVQNDHKSRVVALSFLGRDAFEHFIFARWQGCTMTLNGPWKYGPLILVFAMLCATQRKQCFRIQLYETPTSQLKRRDILQICFSLSKPRHGKRLP
ncbi:hypothetical protein KY284_017357 [Solanum tuberosum]|nr:hypothetical protein KY284_017357 [Solanum tuberosum]